MAKGTGAYGELQALEYPIVDNFSPWVLPWVGPLYVRDSTIGSILLYITMYAVLMLKLTRVQVFDIKDVKAYK
jgi:hypothetical protein